MDPNVALIVGALVAGAAKVGEQAIQDAYNGLKALIVRKFSGNNKIEGALQGVEDDSETWQKPLEKALAEVDAGKDAELVAAAQRLKSELAKVGDTFGMSSTQIGGQGNVQQNIGKMTGGTVIGRQTNVRRDDQ